MGSIWYLDEGDSYEEILMWARRRLEADEQAGGDKRSMAIRLRRRLDEHVTANGRKGEPCLTCDCPWPCGVIRFILSAG